MIEQENGFINVDVYVARYGIKSPQTIEALRQYPVLCYLLGAVKPAGVTDKRPDDIERNIWFLMEGSGMFGLKNREDAERWKGIFTHIVGTAGQVYYVANRLKELTHDQRQNLIQKGYNFDLFDSLTPQQLRDFMLISHAGRRAMDERRWHKLSDDAHISEDSYTNTLKILTDERAPQPLKDLLTIESHNGLLQAQLNNKLPNIAYDILTYCDWTFARKPVTLDERFPALQQENRILNAPAQTYDTFKTWSQTFEKDMVEIFGKTFREEMADATYEWQSVIKNAYWQESAEPTSTFVSEPV